VRCAGRDFRYGTAREEELRKRVSDPNPVDESVCALT
jgi:hypothetical protein